MRRSPECGGRLLTLAFAGVAILFLSASVLAHLHASGSTVLRWQRIQLAPSEMVAEQGHCYIVPTAHGEWMSAHAGPSVAQALEDGRLLGPANAMHDDIRMVGGGRYSFWHGHLYFSSSDGSDPRHNGRRYEVYWPQPLKGAWLLFLDGMAVLLLGVTAWAGFDRYSRSLREGSVAMMERLGALGLSDPIMIAAVIGLCAWGVRFAAYRSMSAEPARFITGSTVMGVPYSDARQWDQLGEAVARGEGLRGRWSARRPFYAVFLGLIYAWVGPSPAVAIHANLILAALTAALIVRLGSAVCHPLAGLTAGLAFAIDAGAIEQPLTTLSETLGLYLFVLSLYLLARSGREASLRATFGGGIALALSNLTRPVAALLELAIVLILCGAPWRRGPGLRGVYRAPALFLLSIALVTTPWLVRQRLVHGITALSDNGVAALYAVSSPRHGSWSGAIDREAQAAGVPLDVRLRYEYFGEALLRNLREQPRVFLENSVASCLRAVDRLTRQPWPARAPVALAILLFGLGKLGGMAHARAGLVWVLLCGLCTVGVFMVSGVALLVAAVAGMALRAIGGGLGLLLAAAFLASLLGLAISGLGGEPRLLVTISWMVPCAASFASTVLLARVATRFEGRAPEPDPAMPRKDAPLVIGLTRGVRTLTRLIVTLAVFTGSYLAIRTVRSRPLEGAGAPSLAQERMIFERVRAVHPDLFAPGELEGDRAFFRAQKDVRSGSIQDWHGKLVAMLARIDRHRYVLPQGLMSSHYSRMFAERDYRRTFFYLSGQTPDGTRGPELAMMGGSLPDIDPAQSILIAGRASIDMRFPYEELLLEVMAVVPAGRDGRLDWDALCLAVEPSHLARLQALQLRASTQRE